VLPSRHRITRGGDFARVIRHGIRVGRPTVVVHLLVEPVVGDAPDLPRAGFVVSKAVGGAVVRNRVARRLRHLVREALPALPAGALLVVRALPAAAGATASAGSRGGAATDLGSDVRSALETATRRGQAA
jgi:ribonuclease P protein component